MKDKPSKQFSMNDAVIQTANKQRKDSGKIFTGHRGGPDSPIISAKAEPIINDAHMIQYETKIKEYNKNIVNLNPAYASLNPVYKVLVRCFHLEAQRRENGLIIPAQVTVKVPTASGYGYLPPTDSPWLYSSKAIVVASYTDTFTPGMLVQLGPSHLYPVSSGKDSKLIMPNAFTHYEWNNEMPPTDPSNEHFGYLLIPSRSIEIILPNDTE